MAEDLTVHPLEDELDKAKKQIQDLETECQVKAAEIRRLHGSCRVYDRKIKSTIETLTNLRDYSEQLEHTYSRGQIQLAIDKLNLEDPEEARS